MRFVRSSDGTTLEAETGEVIYTVGHGKIAVWEHGRHRRSLSNLFDLGGVAEVRHPRASGVAVDVHETERATDARRRLTGQEP